MLRAELVMYLTDYVFERVRKQSIARKSAKCSLCDFENNLVLEKCEMLSLGEAPYNKCSEFLDEETRRPSMRFAS